MHPIYVADFKDDRVLMGASHNVFVGKIEKGKVDNHTLKTSPVYLSISSEKGKKVN